MYSDAFIFKNIQFGYKQKVVLSIPDLRIPKSGMVFIVGPSGVGKSTLLESIGLMSNTFVDFDPLKSQFGIAGEALNPISLWRDGANQLTAIRESLFSFIFQNTNLMPNFSILENILMAANFESEDEERIIQEIKELFQKMNLPAEALDRFPYEISGGQKQRVAFVRALVGKFSILLADEPTGNLDMENSKALFQILSDHIHAQRKVAVVVTHHTELAREYGNMIIEILPTSSGYATTKVIDRKSVGATIGAER